VLPNNDGSVLLVAGDVSGKGLKAAMLVTLVVGALINRRATRPAGVLAELNTALQGQCGGGFVTCCCALFREDAVFIANAGHIPPYCDGVPVEVESSLPLGIVSGLDFIETRLDAGFGDRFVFMSDGIAEARNAAGDLLGFDAVRALAHASPAEIAQRAQRFGQEDDMTVIEVQRLATEAHAA